MSTAFKLLSGKYTGSIFSQSEILSNPVAGLMVGVLATILVQSSSTSTSIVVTMVASGIVDVKIAIPIIMGANVGTSVTNTLVSMTQAADREVFERAFAGATVHDMFNWLTVIVLLPLEVTTGALYRLTSVLVSSPDLAAGKYKKQDLLKVITKPLTSRIVQLDKKVLKGLALGDEKYLGKSMIKRYNGVKESKATTSMPISISSTPTVPSTANVLKIASQEVVFADQSNNGVGVRIAGQQVNWPTSTMEGVASTLSPAGLVQMNETLAENVTGSLFSILDVDDTTSGIILLIASLMLLCVCLVCIVKLLQSMMKSKICGWIKKMVNAEFPGCFRHLTGYVAIFLGAVLTIVVQSSSVFTSTLTPLVGVGLIEIERMYPLTLGSNIGTTMTGILAALAASRNKLGVALQIALCHLFFNIIGIMIFYPIPALRRLPLRAAKFLGRITAKYRWFCIVYLILMFLVLPLMVFSLSLAGKIAVIIAVAIAATLVSVIIILNVLQRKCKDKLPKFLQSWEFLPEFLRSLEPYDRVICKVISLFKSICPCCRRDETNSDNGKETKSLLHQNLTLSSPGGKSKPEFTVLNESPNSSNLSSKSSLNDSAWSASSNSPIVKKGKSKRTRV
ncbi:hypothetical protein FSP39_016895 [Pinctada imbricata]|uniref:Uncharacterized protein n=1 Tax=Pinctada imbricata TaxID=66713 RepID=A0AA88YIN3_PINIB|nr:hypothetical protein FSP39_016895 [Pinctada imbricata]